MRWAGEAGLDERAGEVGQTDWAGVVGLDEMEVPWAGAIKVDKWVGPCWAKSDVEPSGNKEQDTHISTYK